MAAVIYDFRQFQTVRDNVQKAGLNPSPLFAKLRTAQRSGDRGMAVVCRTTCAGASLGALCTPQASLNSVWFPVVAMFCLSLPNPFGRNKGPTPKD